MPLLPSNFESNSLSGTVKVSGGSANISLAVSKFAFEGDKSFVLKLRRNSFDGPILATSNVITLVDRSEIISLTANTGTVAEGNLVSLSLVTANVVNGANVFFSIFPATANITPSDFFGANTGIVTINDNLGTVVLQANADYSLVDETGEAFRVQIRTVDPRGNIVFVSSNIAIADFYKRINVFRFVESATNIAEGTSVTFTVFAHNIPTGNLLYYYTSGNADISGSNVGSIAMNSVSNTITITTASTVPGNQTRNFALVLSESDLGTPIATSNTISVADLALTTITATGGNVVVDGGYKIHTFTISSNLSITGSSPVTQMEYLAVGGGGGSERMNSNFNYRASGGGGGGGVLFGNLPAAMSQVGNVGVIVGAGGASVRGSNTLLGSLVAVGGGVGSGYPVPGTPTEVNGGSGGGQGDNGSFGTGYPGQGNPGGAVGGGINAAFGGGGGGYNSPGKNGIPSTIGGNGGFGYRSTISGANVGYGGGGGGGSANPSVSLGFDGGGNGFNIGSAGGAAGTVNTGGGAGGMSGSGGIPGVSGGSGIVIIRYPYVNPPFFNSVTANTSDVSAGGNAFFVVNTTFANGSVLFYDTLGNITASSFVGGNTGSFTITSNATVLRLQTVGNIPTGETRNFQLRIREDSATTGNIVLVGSNVTVYDSNTGIYLNATGGNVSTLDGYKIHTFNTSDTFTVSSLGLAPYNSVEYLVVAGGAGGGSGDNGDGGGAGGGAGGFLANTTTISLSSYTVTVGAGGGGGGYNAGQTGTNGSNSEIISPSPVYGANILALGGGGGGHHQANGLIGGSGGGEGGRLNAGGALGTLGQGNLGGRGAAGAPPVTADTQGGGGGGGGASQAGGRGSNPAPTVNLGGKGGDGRPSLITGANVIYAGGGGGGAGRGDAPTGVPHNGAGGAGGGGAGGIGNPGTVNTGGGGGGAMARISLPAVGGSGGSGIVIIRYPFF